jgi:hypothetical protein
MQSMQTNLMQQLKSAATDAVSEICKSSNRSGGGRQKSGARLQSSAERDGRVPQRPQYRAVLPTTALLLNPELWASGFVKEAFGGIVI